MPKIVTPLSAPGPSTSGVRRVRPERSACIEEAAHLLAGCFRRLDEADMEKAPTTNGGGLHR